MDNTINSKGVLTGYQGTDKNSGKVNNLSQAMINKQYTIKKVDTDNTELKDFLFTLGCYEGEEVTVISILADNYVITIKDARYSIDRELAEAIII